MIEILLIAAIVFAGRSMFDHARAARKASEGSRLKEAAKAFGGTMPKHKVKATARRHTLGWWLREAGNGFPVARTGWHAGWIAHRTEYLQHAGHREDARTRHVEAQADAAEQVKDHAERRAAARARRDAILAQVDSAPTFGGKEGSRKEVQKAADAVVLPFAPRDRPHAPLPADTVGKPAGKPEPGPYAPTRRADGEPETEADRRFFDLRESGYDGPIDQDGNIPDGAQPGPDASGNPNDPATAGLPLNDPRSPDYVETPDEDALAEDDPPSPATQGAPVSDTTFTSVVNDARAALAQSDQDTAEIRARKDAAYATADSLAAAGADPAVISAQMDYADQLAVAEKALAAAGEHAGATANTAEKYHGQMQEAHDSAPGKVAERAFHEGS
jgi:hypothetical protein